MNPISKKSSLIILALTSIVGSKKFFWLINDPEGPNLLIVTVLAAIIYALSWAVYTYSTWASGAKKLLLAIAVQILIVSGLYLLLN